MPTPAYFFEADGHFVVEAYNDAAPFASFLPGVAGREGVPLWAFYVNRGQGLASFGIRNKDGAMLEFFPADKAYQLTASRGFRTFLKIRDGERLDTHEPFRRGAGDEVRQRMHIAPHEFGAEETHSALQLRVRADCFTLPEAPLAGLVRRVVVQNLAPRARTVEIADGLPQVLPYGLNQWCVKFMSRTSEAYMRVEGLAERLAFFRLKVLPTDSPLIEPVTAGHFFAGFLDGERTRVVADAEKIFGLADDFSRPERFFADAPLEFDAQVEGNRTPAAFQVLALTLAPGECRTFYGLYGHAPSWTDLRQFLAGTDGAAYFEAKREDNRRLIEGLTRRAFTATAEPRFDAYARQCCLDNGLRGGFSVPAPGGARLYLFGRKHGDLERDYNDFLLQDTQFSEGNGDFRDMLQNRRMDTFFDPALEAKNIRYFFNLIQPDGYNPQALRNTRYWLQRPEAFAEECRRIPGLAEILAGEFKYAQLWQTLRAAGAEAEPILADILAQAREVEDAEFDRGYWSDHWTYLVDLLESYAAIFPDRLTELFREESYTFFDPTHFVLPRARKYRATPKGLRQYGAVEARPEKIALIRSRPDRRFQARDRAGTGEIVRTTLLGKILTLAANKLASLDPFGVGIEMEADRPGWCDAMNGLPGLLGSSVNETFELKRLADFARHALADLEGECPLPAELAEFAAGLRSLSQDATLSAFEFWRRSHALKEAYRERTFMGFEGARRVLSFAEARDFLAEISVRADRAVAGARTPEGIVAYFVHDAETFATNARGEVEVSRFRRRALPPFLEGFVHALRVAAPAEVRSLYEAVRASELYDRTLGMYRLNVPLGEDALEFGRIGIFNYGWLENGSIFLHMHYKFVLETVRRGLLREFYDDIETLLVPFRDSAEYRRNPAESVSFLVCGGFAVDPRERGRGCVARLSGATVEFLHLWTHLFLGPRPFVLDAQGLAFRPQPGLSKTFFSTEETTATPFGEAETLPRDSVACALLGNTLLVYLNPERRDTFGPDAAVPRSFRLYGRDGAVRDAEGDRLAAADAEALRGGAVRRVDIRLGALR